MVAQLGDRLNWVIEQILGSLDAHESLSSVMRAVVLGIVATASVAVALISLRDIFAIAKAALIQLPKKRDPDSPDN